MTVADNNWKTESLSPSRTTGGETERPDLVRCNPEAVTRSSQAGRRCRFNKIGFMRKMKFKVCLQRLTATQTAVTTHSGDGSQKDSINILLNPFFCSSDRHFSRILFALLHFLLMQVFVLWYDSSFRWEEIRNGGSRNKDWFRLNNGELMVDPLKQKSVSIR